MSPSENRKLRARLAVFATATVVVASALASTTGNAFVIEDKEGNLPKKEPIEQRATPAVSGEGAQKRIEEDPIEAPAAPAIRVEESREPIPKQDNAEMTAVLPETCSDSAPQATD